MDRGGGGGGVRVKGGVKIEGVVVETLLLLRRCSKAKL